MNERVADGLYAIHGIGADSNSYAIKGNKTILVDTGTGRNPEYLLSDLKDIKAEPDFIINTHCHGDHVGGNRLFPDHVPVYAHHSDANAIKTGDASRTLLAVTPTKDVRLLPDGIEGWKVLHTPGHTPGSVCLLKNRILISGDTVFAQGFGRTDLVGGNPADLKASLQKLAELDIEILLPGHGEIVKTNANESIKRNLKMAGGEWI
jgi:hydroxyacylglutathione hydrolase